MWPSLQPSTRAEYCSVCKVRSLKILKLNWSRTILHFPFSSWRFSILWGMFFASGIMWLSLYIKRNHSLPNVLWSAFTIVPEHDSRQSSLVWCATFFRWLCIHHALLLTRNRFVADFRDESWRVEQDGRLWTAVLPKSAQNCAQRFEKQLMEFHRACAGSSARYCTHCISGATLSLWTSFSAMLPNVPQWVALE